ncbi:MAG: homoserine dehydrogenase [Lentisphaerae bacterium]|nr:homoserine dehydrogenase [Lentisphaerota bacterium]
MKEVGIGIVGFGTIGTGVVEGLQRNGALIAERAGARPVVRRIADIDTARDRGIALAAGVLVEDAEAVVADPAVDVVVELIGGTGAAGEVVRRALEAGKPVVTANKALLAERGRELFELAGARRVDLYFGASVGGGIPIVRVLREALAGNRIASILGILNGTCNYILTRMEAEGLSFDAALGEAQARGFAEADPSLDVDGLDTAHKAVILASLAYGFIVPMRAVSVEGLRRVSATDIVYARDLGYRIKLLAVVKDTEDGIEVRVHPTLVPLDHVLASVSGEFNAVMVRGDLAGETLYYGRGAGRYPTASTVIGDIVDVIRNLGAGSPARVPAMQAGTASFRPMASVRTRYYLRLALLDRPGALARTAAVLGAHEISIASAVQHEQGEADGDYAPVVLLTHEAREAACDAALEDLGALDVVGSAPLRLRIEE